MDIHGAAAAAFIETEPPDPERREGELPKNSGRSYETTWPRVSVGHRRAVVSALTPEESHVQRRDFQGLT